MSASSPEGPSPAQRWFALAIEDLAAAQVLIVEGSVALRIAGFLAQQAAEKALKAGLFAASIAVPRIHGLNQLLARFPSVGAPDVDPDDLDLLDPWVIDGRYAADLPDLERSEATNLCWPPTASLTRSRLGNRTLSHRPETTESAVQKTGPTE
jgi:HEPN domain-containing protein